MRVQPAEVLRKHRSEIVEEWARHLRGLSDTGYSRRPLQELRDTCGECFDGYLEFVEERNVKKLDSFTREITRRRAALGFRSHDVMGAFGAFLPIALGALEQEGGMEMQSALFEPVEYALAACATQYAEATQRELVAAMQQLAATVAGSVDEVQAVADAALESAARLTGSQYGYLDLLDTTGQRLRRSMVGLKPEDCALFSRARPYTMGRGLFGRIITERKPLLTNCPASERSRIGTPKNHPPIECFLGAPVLSGEKVLGVMSVANKPGGYTEEDASLLFTFANMAAPALEAARLVESLRASQEQLMQAAKMAAVGELISGIAHELNNPLTGVLGFTQLLMGMDLKPKSRELADKVYQQAQRAARIVANLLTFARKHVPEMTAVSVNQVIQATVELRAYELKVGNIQVQMELDPHVPPTMADAHVLQQVFVNLINNAEQAIKGSKDAGTITIKTELVGETIRIGMSDDGAGMPAEVIEQAFEPFFTTKPAGEGTGLGLSICRKIIEEHKGKIWTESKQGEGTSFLIELPLLVPETKEEAAMPPVEEGPTRRATILVVDDELPVQELVRNVLEAEGHEVHLASNGDAALTCLGAYEYDLVISDIKMPRLGGEELYAQIRSRWPRLARRVLFFTGDVVADKTRVFLEKGGLPHITKPFDLAHVRRVVRAALSRDRQAASDAEGQRP